jgi:hypothetical protein
MRSFPTGFLVASSLSVILFGFVYGLVFARILYQNSTPEMSANYEFHTSVSNTILVIILGTLQLRARQYCVRCLR